MKDICIDARMANYSGIGTYIREILPYFCKSLLRVTLLVDKIGNEWCRGFDQTLFQAPIYSIREQILYPMRVPTCDLFFSPHYNVPIFPIAAKKRVVTIHDVCHLVRGSKLQKRYAQFLCQKALKSDRVITVSNFSKMEILKHFGPCPIDVIPIAANVKRFYTQTPSLTVRKKYNLPKRFVLYIGNNKPHKNLDGLKKAFAKVDIPGLKLVIAGKGTPFGEIADADLPQLYNLAEAFVFPSKYEGFGLPPLEAMSSGCPTVVSKAASIPEVCGEASLYFDPENFEEMANAIREVVNNQELREDLIAKGFERVKSFSWKKAAEDHLKLFEEVLDA